MANDQEQAEEIPTPRVDRRDFLKLGAAGLAGGLAACAAPGGGAPSPGSPAATPDIGPLVDPETVPVETWQEPWTWRPERWPGAALELNVVQNLSPGFSPSPGNPAPMLFSYNGSSPAPTVRVRQDGSLNVRVRNTLGLNRQETPVGPGPDPFELPPAARREVCAVVEREVRGGDPAEPRDCPPFRFPEQFYQVVRQQRLPGWSLSGHVNGLHGAHTTNLHTHGLHVQPQRNADGSHSDDVFLRIIPQADLEARRAAAPDEAQHLAHHEHVAQLDYRFELAFERDGQSMPHPPGTHWYHPHSHGATHDQVANGMAGYLIVEGDVDEAVNRELAGEPWPDPTSRTGPWDYRERLVFIQRVAINPADLDAGPHHDDRRFPPVTAVNGIQPPAVMRMRPGAVERWRVLNGSVDGAGSKRFMVLAGQFVHRDGRLWRVVSEGPAEARERRLEAVTGQQIEEAKVDLFQLSFDGITLVSVENGRAVHRIKDLSQQNRGTANPLNTEPRPGENPDRADLRAIESVYRDGDSLRRCFVRPNEVFLGNANRADLFFRAPREGKEKVYTVLAKEVHAHSDVYQHRFQRRAVEPDYGGQRALLDVVLAYLHVDGEPVAGADFDFAALSLKLPPVPPLLQPIAADELRVPEEEARVTGVPANSVRTRTISYSGYGGVDFPVVICPQDFVDAHPELENLVWSMHEGVPVLLPNLTHSMGINTEFDLAANPQPMLPRKFAHDDPMRSRVLVDTAEEWVLYNNSLTLWAHTDRERFPQPGAYRDRYVAYPITRAEGQRRFAEDPEFRITAKGTDHPFHIHVNPMWVLRIDVPDEHGRLHNVLPEPAWMDTVNIPRNGGRVVFRTRFDDFTGSWVNHCHILIHEDMGMMQQVECTDRPAEVNYRPRQQPAGHDMSAAEVDAIYPPPSLELMYRQSMAFVDPGPVGGQVYPGFELEVPRLDDD